jgi:hypothetical protein
MVAHPFQFDEFAAVSRIRRSRQPMTLHFVEGTAFPMRNKEADFIPVAGTSLVDFDAPVF